YGGKGRADGLTFKRQVPRCHFVNHDSKGEQVRSRVQFLALHLLRRHEGDGSWGGAHSGDILISCGAGFVENVPTVQVNVGRHFCQAEVKYLDVLALRHEEIGGLDIAMNDPYGVYRLQSIGYLNGQ